MKWHKFTEGKRNQKLPDERKLVLCLLPNEKDDELNLIVVGYVRKWSGGPVFITPGLFSKNTVQYWCDCLQNSEEIYKTLPKENINED